MRRMRFCTIDEQIESFILPFSESVSERSGVVSQAAWVGGGKLGPSVRAARSRQREVIIA